MTGNPGFEPRFGRDGSPSARGFRCSLALVAMPVAVGRKQSHCLPTGTKMKNNVKFFGCHTCEKFSQASLRRRSFRKVRKVMKRLSKKSFRGEVNMAYPSVRNMYRVETPYQINNKRQCRKSASTAAGAYRHWARISLSRRYVPSKQRVDPDSDSVAGLSFPCGRPHVSNDVKIQSRFARLVGDAKHRKLFLKICRGILSDLGISLVGPLPFRCLEIMWEYFGEEHFSGHGRACWCRLCRSVGPARFTFVQAIGDSVLQFFVNWKTIPSVIFGIIAPAPLRTAKFVANKLWKWLKILFDED